MEYKFKNKKIGNFLKKISYRYRREKRVKEYEEKYLKYLNLSDAEFLMDYSHISAKYENNKITFNLSWFTGIIIFIFSIYKYIVALKKGLSKSTLSFNENYLIFSTSIFILSILIILAVLIFYLINRKRIKIIEEKSFFDEVKQMRMEKGNNDN